MRTVFSEYEPVPGTILRLAAPPGAHRFQVRFFNQVTEAPQTVSVQVVDGKITPVHVTLTPGGTTSVRGESEAFYRGRRGARPMSKIASTPNQAFQIGLAAEPSQPYQPKERMRYFSAGP